jgi:hypothetical protein
MENPMPDPPDIEPHSAPPAAVPVSPAAVERVVNVLTQRFAQDELTQEDLETRLERVYAATTMAELGAVITDLGAVSSPSPSPASQLGVHAAQAERVTAMFSGQERRITGVAPAALDLRARLGYVEVDLTRAIFGPGVTVIDVRAFMGYVQLRLPPNVRVESGGRAIFGFFSVKGSGAPEEEHSTPVVRVTGRAIFGFAECVVASGDTPLLP